MTKFRLKEIAERLHGCVEGDAEALISGVAGLEDAEEGDISFLANARYLGYLSSTRASAIIVGTNNGVLPKGRNYVLVHNPYMCFLNTIEIFYPQKKRFTPGIHPTAVIDPTVKIGQGVYIGPYVVLAANSQIGDGVVLQARAYVGENSVIGDQTRLMPGATVLDNVKVGKRCFIQSGCVLGGDGFGFVCDQKGVQQKIPQVSGLIIGDDVEVGSNTTIDRGTLSPTRIGNGVKFDNLVHIAHNVEIGDNTLVVAQVGVSGSTKIGKSVILAGQSGLGGHITIGDGAKVGAQSGVTKSVSPGMKVSGYPARPHIEAMKNLAFLSRLPKMLMQIRELMKRMKKLEQKPKK